MRLSKITLAGFKSFVDPTTIHLPSNLVGVVGPNGCGKSNVIDAIRWVMGETSARHLRGDSMEDVIFNGCSTRKPVGTATVELCFDNSTGTFGGQYGSYAEISIRRTVSRDGQSQYFLNNTRCRRKDITGLFMGTGLGPRSYAIIEQGMVSRLVDAKPDEMRAYVEEAAGISRYKERRRETETRMQHTRDNLARLADLRDEVEKQIRHLQRQAQVAERYRVLKQTERRLEAELLAMRLTDLDGRLSLQRTELSARQTELEGVLAGQRQIELEIEQARAAHGEASEAFTVVQARYYTVQGEIARLEQALTHARELRERELRELAKCQSDLESVTLAVAQDTETLRTIEDGLAGFEPQLVSAREREAAAQQELQAGERALDDWQDQWHTFNLDVKEQQQARQVEQTRLEHLEAHHARLTRQLESVEGERLSISVVDLEARLEARLVLQRETEQLLRTEADAMEAVTAELARQRDIEQRAGAGIEQFRGELESRRGRLDALRAIQAAALGNEEETLGTWLDSRGLAGSQRVVQQLVADEQWTRAVETVLGDFLQGVLTHDVSGHTAGLPDTTLVLVEAGQNDGRVPADSLAVRVQNAGALRACLAAVRCAETLDDALRVRTTLSAGESVITPDGIWFGPGWLRVHRGQRYTGMVAREQEIRQLDSGAAADAERIAALTASRSELRSAIERLERQRVEVQQRLTDVNRQSLESASQAATLRQDLERARQRLEVLAQDGDSVRDELSELAGVIAEARERLQAAEARLEELEAGRAGRREQQESLLAAFSTARDRAEAERAVAARILIDYESRRAAQGAARAALERVSSQRTGLEERIGQLAAHTAGSEGPLADFQRELDLQLASQVEVQAGLTRQRDLLTGLESRVKSAETRRHELEKQVGAGREHVEQLRMEVREFEVRRESFAERFAAAGQPLEAVIAQLEADADAEQWEQRLAQARTSIERLGPINLAAIDEFAEQSERKKYLDAQHADLSSALETLEHAIRRIDRETRTRFQETFENINAGLKRLFPRLFGGGHAYLTLEGDDVLTAGVTVMARPPGKRNSHIHLLSGGEKALTAVALIFSIFELNPAPFCLLDEVDAPLDEANVGRFCEIVREMSATVQFVVITHNKTTMEMTRQLTGVTMNEPGVSRLVAVDIDEAVKLAAS